MSLTAGDFEIIGAYVAKMLHDRGQPIGLEGVAQASTWNPGDGTVSVAIGSMQTAFPDTDDQPVLMTKIAVGTSQIGDQYAPSGKHDERVTLFPAECGYVAIFQHGDDDSPGTPAGERWICHRNDAGDIDAFIKHTNDGATAGDGLGGAHYGGNAGKTTATTKSGHAVTLDDTARTAKMTSADGLESKLDDAATKITHTAGSVVTILDGAGNAISHVATHIGLGDLFGSITADGAALAKSHLTQFESDLWSQRLDDLTKFAAAMVTAGVPNAGSVLALLATLLHVPVPAGSSIVRIK